MLQQRQRRWLVPAGLAAVIVAGLAATLLVWRAAQPERTTPLRDPPVLAGQQLWGPCGGGFYARHGASIVLTSSGHCAAEGTVAQDPDGSGVRGVFGPAAWEPTCVHPNHRCAVSDMNYMVVAEDRIPWGHLNELDFGTGGYRVVPPGTRPFGCDDVDAGDPVEINGRNIHRAGTVTGKGQYLHDPVLDGDYFPCMITADIGVATGDSGGAVLVGGVPAGVTSRSFDGLLGFTPLAEGLERLGLVLCTEADCGLAPSPSPTTAAAHPRTPPDRRHSAGVAD